VHTINSNLKKIIFTIITI